ncbi:unnamed protein product [Victoria cruziana]
MASPSSLPHLFLSSSSCGSRVSSYHLLRR